MIAVSRSGQLIVCDVQGGEREQYKIPYGAALMIEQGDFLITHKMPLIKPTFHPLDRVSNWNKIDSALESILDEKDYIPVHY